MEVLHCNACGYYPNRNVSGLERRRFYLTSCGHVICYNCTVKQGESVNCLVCKTASRSVEICANSKPEIKAFFLDPMEKVKESVQTAVWMLNFQRAQMKSYSYHVSKSDAARIKLEQENKSLKEEIVQLKQQLEINKGVQSWPKSMHDSGWPKGGGSPQMGTSFMNTPGQSFMAMFPQSTSPGMNSEIEQTQRLSDSQAVGSTNNTGLRLKTHMGPGRLTLPFTPIRTDAQRQYSPGSSISAPSYTSGSDCSSYGTPASSTPDLTARLRQLQCQAKSGYTSNGQYSQQRQYY